MIINENVHLFITKQSWIEGNAIEQLRLTANLPGVLQAAGMPDLHMGKGCSVGAVILSKGLFYPHLIGSDIGCGMGFFKTHIKAAKMKKDKLMRKLKNMNMGIPHTRSTDTFDPELETQGAGTIGGGNHFAELQKVEDVFAPEEFTALALDARELFLLVHSGSRGLGESILQAYVDKRGYTGLEAGSREAEVYLARHDFACRWARYNRGLIAENILLAAGGHKELVTDLFHNYLEAWEKNGEALWLHRKGAAPADRGVVMIPGSRGALSYLVRPVGSDRGNLCSLAHGAGRKWNRSSCKGRLREKYKIDELKQGPWSNPVICSDKELLYEEAPEAYKNIETVIKDLSEWGLIQVIASFRPVITYKKGNSEK